MKTIALFALLSAAIGCEKDAAEPDDSGSAGGEAPCVVLPDGDWTLQGTSLGHDMFGTLVFDVDACSFTLSDWQMQMDIATGGSIDGDEVTFGGDGTARDWGQCTGTAEDENTVRAQCDDGATLTMDFDG